MIEPKENLGNANISSNIEKVKYSLYKNPADQWRSQIWTEFILIHIKVF